MLELLHRWFLVVLRLGQEKPTAQDLHSRIVDLLPPVKAAPLAQGAHSVGEGMVKIMEEHLVEAVPAPQDEGHHRRQHGVAAVGVQRQEFVPPVGVVEVGEEGPSHGEAEAAHQCHRQQEAPALGERPAQRPGAQKPNTGPQRAHEKAVAQALRHPLGPEVFVALAAGGVREVAVPHQGEEGPRVVGAHEVPERH